MPPASFSTEEMDVLRSLAQPLAAGKRDAFLEAVASALDSTGARGPGRVHQVAREVQRQFFNPPELNTKGYAAPFPRR
jgi:hypothetical protein